MTVGELMQRDPVTLNVGDTLGLADDIMRLGRIRHLPVVSGTALVGIVSQRDLFRAAVSSVLSFAPAAEREWLAGIPVRSVMTTDVVTVAPDTSIRQAVRVMLERSIGCLPVVNAGNLLGLVTETDCLRHLAQVLALVEQRTTIPELGPAA